VRRTLKLAGWALLAVVVLASALGVHTWYFKPLRIEWFYDRLFASFVLGSPEFMSSLRILPSWLDFYGGDLDDASPREDQRQAALVRAGYATLHNYDESRLAREARLSYDALDYYLRDKVDGERFRTHDFPVNQLFGVQSELPDFMVQIHAVTTPREARRYVERLNKFPRKFDQLLESLRLRESMGVIPPRFTVDKVLAQMERFVATPPKSNALYTSFEQKLGKLPAGTLDAGERDRILAQTERALEGSVYPAYRSVIAYFTALQAKATGNEGAWHLPQGDAYYAWCVRDHTTTDMTPDEVHTLGLSEVARVGSAMDAILRQRGLRDGSIGARMEDLKHDPSLYFPATAEGKAAMLDRYRSLLDTANRRLDEAFAHLPSSQLEVRAIPQMSEATGPIAYYSPGSLDGARPGVFYANTRDPREVPRFAMPTVAYHEGVPGHHLQGSIAREMRDVPTFRKVIPFTAYIEGWALYAEQLAWELGLENDPLDNLGRLNDEMLRSVRLVVDTGIHAKRWTREQAIAYMRDNTGLADADIVAEVERYFVQPGQALAYKVGMLRILALREKARTALGPRFDIRAFHEEVLAHGALPLVVLDKVVDDWIARERAAPRQ
jgi:uncharacterized protein (DUF885 family)